MKSIFLMFSVLMFSYPALSFNDCLDFFNINPYYKSISTNWDWYKNTNILNPNISARWSTSRFFNTSTTDIFWGGVEISIGTSKLEGSNTIIVFKSGGVDTNTGRTSNMAELVRILMLEVLIELRIPFGDSQWADAILIPPLKVEMYTEIFDRLSEKLSAYESAAKL